MLRGVLIAIVGERCSQLRSGNQPVCPGESWGHSKDWGPHGAENWCVIWKMKNRTMYPPSLSLYPDHLQPGSLSVANTAVLDHLMLMLSLTRFHKWNNTSCVLLCLTSLAHHPCCQRLKHIQLQFFTLCICAKHTGSVLARKIYCLILCPKYREKQFFTYPWNEYEYGSS